MKIIVGLGNPGKRYEFSRHNVGFMVLDALVKNLFLSYKKSLFRVVYTAQGLINKREILLVKPTAYMNRSGESIRRLVAKHKIDSDGVLVVYDDVDIPLGKIRIKKSGGSAGHKGMESIINALATDKIGRLRIGIGRPEDKSDEISDYVLSDFADNELKDLKLVILRAAQCCWDWADKDINFIMNKYNA
ncbi:MAG: aminoacyl-tRNA hydrolase [Candidatus Omnitrophota bacterium]